MLVPSKVTMPHPNFWHRPARQLYNNKIRSIVALACCAPHRENSFGAPSGTSVSGCRASPLPWRNAPGGGRSVAAVSPCSQMCARLCLDVAKYTCPGSNWGSSACRADVITTRPQVLIKEFHFYHKHIKKSEEQCELENGGLWVRREGSS